MLVGDIGEFELIDALESAIGDRNRARIEELRGLGVETTLGIGDDAAAWTYPPSTVVSTTDAMVEGVHFTAATTPWRDLGWKALASNLSDVGAMGCLPTFALATLGARGDTPVYGLRLMYMGMMDALERCGGALVGGDVVRSDTFFLSVALEGIALGDAPILRRDAAKPGDSIGVTGKLGRSAAGLRLLLEPRRAADIHDAIRRRLIAAHVRPTPRVREGATIRRLGARCAMDISDGLVADLRKLCAASGVSARVRADSLPADDALSAAFPEDRLRLALSGGEDYELAFTADDATMAKIVDELGDDAITVIGEIGRGSGVRVVDADGGEVRMDSEGWDHFRR